MILSKTYGELMHVIVNSIKYYLTYGMVLIKKSIREPLQYGTA